MFAVELLAELVRRGVEDVVVCPGSRSQALALAAAAAERAEAVRLHVRLDERSAAFFALGVARETGVPAPVIVTSGTAVANLMPAVLEAHEGRVPLLLLTADRPSELRGIRSNQTTRQAGLFDTVARFSRDVPAPRFASDGDLDRADGRDPGALAAAALAAAAGTPGARPPGPVHLTLAFREPLSGTAGFDEMIARGFAAASAEAAQLRASDEPAPDYKERSAYARAELSAMREPVTRAMLAESVWRASWLAEAVSGARFGREAIAAYATLLEDPALGGLVEQAIVFGHPTLTRQLPALLRRDDVEVIVVDPYGEAEHYDPSGGARVVRAARVAEDHDPRALRRWLGAWVIADRALLRERTTVHEPDLGAALASGYKERSAYARAELSAMREPVTRAMLAESVWRASWPHDRLVLAASRLVRVLDGLAPARRLEVRANRGLAGIDGTVATALGVAAASQASEDPARAAGTTRVLLGDLALLHDAGSLLLPESEPRPRVQLFVGNDGGGTIFADLEVAGSAPAADFERVMTTPQSAELAALAAAYGWEYRRVSTRGELEQLLTEPVAGPSLIEIPLSG
ncbi:2-succinyl-5-enolpyruvyl-6-hydroxy-3-cyclohexene-1-carboxylic-acid synthase [Leucobacter massiliensis]|uniref:2-succinyl-5-enolpyruvyl-6-hydroxy-3-cyclohexene-1-carboxylate synthase n=1 Tax=Leucobacter massiliensis TaxID=1686285 RepID=A0A2S9QP63_9MICO|nr:2-succinyl-5-enolpyruvyl-6-hydroxy-3-cyclohexene-1-carboxylic-acid synthase [Leucobacter massiliensis]